MITLNIVIFDINASCNLEKNGEIVIDCFIPDSIINPSINNVERHFEPFCSNGKLYYVTDKRILENNIETRIVVSMINQVIGCIWKRLESIIPFKK